MMQLSDIARMRLHSQLLTNRPYTQVEELVAHLGAVQAQDYHHAKWALCVRLPGSTDTAIEQAIDEGRIIRTHVLRPTWHLIAPEDARWMLVLSAPQVITLLGSLDQQHGLSGAFYQRVFPLIERALSGHRHLTRKELMAELSQSGIETNNSIATLLMYQAELEALVCNGPRKGKEHTYALLEERVPAGKMLDRPDSIAELARRYFRSHGPATLADFKWWSGLKMSDARVGLEAAQPHLIREQIEGRQYWFPADFPETATAGTGLFLLPGFDEFLISYTDRSAALAPERSLKVISQNAIFKPLIVSDGQVKGTWSRSIKKRSVQISRTLFSSLSKREEDAYQIAAQQFAVYLDLSLALN